MATTTAPWFGDFEPRHSAPRYADHSDERLAHLVGEASDQAFAALYERHHQALYRYCRSIVRDDTDAQDVLQSAWTRALVALRRRQRDAPLRPWLYRIVHNEAISLLRRRGRRAEQPATEADRVPSAEDRAIDRERFASLLADLRELPERPRGALLMRELSGLSHEEIAVALDTSMSAAKQCIYEARRDLAELAAGRAAACDDICRRISDGDRRVLRGRRVSAHLRDCPSCAAFASTIDRRGAALHALAPWLPAVVATAALHEVLRAGSGAGAAGTAAAAGGVGTSAGAGAAGTSAVAAPAAVTAGVVTKAIGVPLLGKSLVAVAAVAAGVASLTGAGGGHAVSRPATVPAAPRSVSAARIAVTHHVIGRAPAWASAASPARGARGPAAPAHGHARPTASAVHSAGRHRAVGHGSGVAPGQARKTVVTPPGQATTRTALPPGEAKRTVTTPPGQATKAVTAPPGRATKAPTNAVATTPSGPAKTTATTSPGQVRRAATTRPGQATASAAEGNSAAAQAK